MAAAEILVESTTATKAGKFNNMTIPLLTVRNGRGCLAGRRVYRSNRGTRTLAYMHTSKYWYAVVNPTV